MKHNNIIQGNNEIFIVDDDKDIRDILKSLLEQQNFHVKEFEHGYDATKNIRPGTPKVLLLDYFLPGEKAESIISSVQKNSKNSTVIILMSANMHVKMDFKDLGVAEFIRKPFSIDVIFSILGKYIN